MCKIKNISTRTVSTLILIFGLILIFILPKNYLFEGNNTWCIHKILFNFDCPGCGMTRALYLILHGFFKEAISYNIAILPFLLLIITHLLSFFLKKNTIILSYKFSLILFTITIFSQYIIKTFSQF
jgi:hypothetical protein